jgi:hypothetical protein
LTVEYEVVLPFISFLPVAGIENHLVEVREHQLPSCNTTREWLLVLANMQPEFLVVVKSRRMVMAGEVSAWSSSIPGRWTG